LPASIERIVPLDADAAALSGLTPRQLSERHARLEELELGPFEQL
jgi:hypothetical protein